MASASAELLTLCNPSVSRPVLAPSCSFNEVLSTRKFQVKPALLEVLKLAGAESEVFTVKEVLRWLRIYISGRILYDISNPKKIVCENDALGKAFGVKTFMISDVLGLLSSNMFSVTTAENREGLLGNKGALPSMAISCAAKRKSFEDEGFISPKRHCPESTQLGKLSNSPMFIEIAESPLYDSSTETVFSYQEYETTAAKDSSDDLWFLETEDEFEVEIDTDEFVEFEVASLSSSGGEDLSSDTESEVAEVVGAAILLCQNDSDVEFWADSSDNDEFGAHSDTDPDITDDDKWKCQHCATLNRPVLRYCQKCWQLRVNWLPDRRRPRRHRKLKRTRSVPNGSADHSLLNSRTRRTSRSLPNVSGADLLQSNDNTEKQETDESATSQKLTDSQESGSQEFSSISSPLVLSECSSSASLSSMCSICLMKPKNASIIHGRTGHQTCCYGCGKKLWERNKPCPVCRRTIQKVIQNFIV